jgi:uroporphyrinogen-III decarboxylase
MRFSVAIDYPPERMEQSRNRMEARADFRYVDRVPVAFCVVPRYFAPLYGISYSEFFRDAETQFRWQLEFAKCRLENIAEDVCQSPIISVAPYFDNVVNASAFGAEIGWGNDETPRARPTIKHPDDVDRLEVPEPTSGLWGKALAWRAEMVELARDTSVTIGGLEGRVEVCPPAIGGEGPHMVAIDLVGEDFYWWMIECPRVCHKLLDKITRGMMRAEDYFRSIDARPRGGYGIAEDSAQVMSERLFREFCVPYDNALYDRFGAGLRDGRGMHMCGNSTHLLTSLKRDARISSFNVFGYMVDPTVVADQLGDGVYLWGNIDPMLMLNGTPAEVKVAARRCLRALAPRGGFMLGDGANICPGTPYANLAAVTEASVEYGLPSK